LLPLFLLCLISVGGVREAGAATAYPPEYMTYQGYLVDANGAPVATNAPANYPIVFRIWDASQNGNLVWSEKQVVTIDKGNYSVLLGEGSTVSGEPKPDLSTVFTGSGASERYMEPMITVGSTTMTIMPRLRMLPSPYAFLAKNASTLVSPNGSNLVVSGNSLMTVNGDVTASLFTGNAGGLTNFSATQIPNLDAGKITSGTLGTARIPNLDASKITTGLLGAAIIPNLDAGKITTGTLGTALIPNLDAAKIALGTLAAARMPLTFNVNKVGVGVTDPYYVFEAGDRIRLRGGGNGTSGIYFNGSSKTNAAFVGLLNDGFVGFYGGCGALWSLVMNTTNGNLGVRDWDPGWPLTIKGYGDYSEWLALKSFDGYYKWYMNGRSNGLNIAESGMTEGRLFIKSGGNIGIGTMAPAFKLHVMGDIGLEGTLWMKHNDSASTPTARWYKLTATDGTFPNAGGYDTAQWWEQTKSSDQRLKKNISTIPEALEKLGHLRGVTYNWNDTAVKLFTQDLEKNTRSVSGKPEDDQKLWNDMRQQATEKYAKPQMGFIAQEIEQVFPEWVTNGVGGYKAINLEHLNAILVNAINEQQAQIAALQAKSAKVAALEQELTALKQQLAAQQQANQTWEARFSALEKVLLANPSSPHSSSLAQQSKP
jgi:hypothetical protein